MLNEERIKLMTKLAAYEQNEGKRNVSIGSYFRGDYIGLSVIKSVIGATIAFILVLALMVACDFEMFMTDVYKMDLMTLGQDILVSYIAFVGIYALISYLVYSYRYTKARKSLKMYYNNLKKLAYLYDREEKNK